MAPIGREGRGLDCRFDLYKGGVTVFIRTRRLVAASRTALAGGVVLATLVVSLGVAVPSSSALGSSPFCKSMFSYETKYASKAAPPTKLTTKSYHAWAKAILPFYETLASEAPNAKTKTVLNEIVTILKYESSASSLTSLEAYINANHIKFENGTKALANAIIACAK
jgi:hypothetical protein